MVQILLFCYFQVFLTIVFGHSYDDFVIERPTRRIDARELFLDYYSNESPVIGQATEIKIGLTIHDIQIVPAEGMNFAHLFISQFQSWKDNRFTFKGRITHEPKLIDQVWKPNLQILNTIKERTVSERVDIFENSTVAIVQTKRVVFLITQNILSIVLEDIAYSNMEIPNKLVLETFQISKRAENVINMLNANINSLSTESVEITLKLNYKNITKN